MNRAYGTIIIVSLLLMFVGCSQNSVDGGGGIETVAKSGKIVDENGDPAKNVVVKAYPDTYNPVTNANSNLVSIDTTNDSGYYNVKISKVDKYNILAHSLDNGYKVLSKDVTDQSNSLEDTIKNTGAMAVYVPEWLKNDSGFVFIPGTDIYASLDDTTDDGVLILSNVPAGSIENVSFYNDDIGADTSIFEEQSVVINSGDTIAIQKFGIVKRYYVGSGHILSDTVHSIVKDVYGNKWYGTGSGGVARFDGNDWFSFTTVNSNLKVNHIYDLWAADNGDVWAGTVGGGVAKFNGQTWNVYDQSNTDLINDSIYVVCGCNTCGGVWLGTDYGLNYMPASSDSACLHFHSGNSHLVGDSVFSLVLNTCGRMFIGTDKGVSFWDGTEWTIWTPENSNLPGAVVYGLIDGQDGTLWAATDNGVATYNGSSWKKINPPVIEHDERYRALAVSSDGELWAGSSGYGTILRSKNGMKLLLTGFDLGFPYDLIRINDIFPEANGTVEIATHYDGILVLGKTDQPDTQDFKSSTIRRQLVRGRF